MPPSAWENFLVASAGAAAALSGLVFVAVSINVQRILARPSLPARAAETLMIFMGVLIVGAMRTGRAAGVRVGFERAALVTGIDAPAVETMTDAELTAAAVPEDIAGLHSTAA